MPLTATILPNERELFLQTASGDESAFRIIFDHYASRIYPFIFAKTRSDSLAQDLTQEIFIKVWNNREQLAGIDNHAAYIFTMAARQVYMHFRKTARDKQLAREWWQRIEQLRNITEEWMDERQYSALVEKAVQQLPQQRRRIYELSRQQGLSHAEIAKELNISTSTVNNQLSEALKFIRKHIEGSAEVALALFIVVLETTQ